MILTGKSKEDFLKWVYSEYDYKYGGLKDFYPLHLLDGLIIEWFDSVGIYVDVFNEFGQFGYLIHTGNFRNPLDDKGHWETRQEAITEALIKANEIYNLKDF